MRWYCRYAVSYRDLDAMMTERGVAVDHSTTYRWVQRFATEIEKRLRWQGRRPRSSIWRVDEVQPPPPGLDVAHGLVAQHNPATANETCGVETGGMTATVVVLNLEVGP